MPISNIISFLAGKTGTGKSFLLNYILRREVQLKRREGIIILDLRADHINLLKEKEFHYLKISADIFNNYNIDWVGVLTKYPYLIIEPYKLSREEYENLANDIAGGIVDIGNRIFVLEEAGLAMPIFSGIRRNLSVLITTGRKLNIDIYFTSQRPAIVNTTAVAEANIRICFSVDDLSDIKRMRNYFEEEALLQLKRFQFIALNTFSHKEIKGDTSNPKILDTILWTS